MNSPHTDIAPQVFVGAEEIARLVGSNRKTIQQALLRNGIVPSAIARLGTRKFPLYEVQRAMDLAKLIGQPTPPSINAE